MERKGDMRMRGKKGKKKEERREDDLHKDGEKERRNEKELRGRRGTHTQ